MRLRHEQQIETALSNMPEVWDARVSSTTLNPLTAEAAELLQKGMIVVQTADDLEQVLRDTYQFLGTIDTTPIDRNLRHERQHGEAALVVGSAVVKYGLGFGSLVSPTTQEVLGIVTQPMMFCELPELELRNYVSRPY